MVKRNIKRANGGGPWPLDLPYDLTTNTHEQVAHFDLQRMTYRGQKGYFVPWLPLEEIQIKNLNSAEPVELEFNGQYNLFVEPNAADTFSDTGIVRFTVKNLGGTTIPKDDIVIHGIVKEYDADDAARREASRSPLENMARGVLGL